MDIDTMLANGNYHWADVVDQTAELDSPRRVPGYNRQDRRAMASRLRKLDRRDRTVLATR